MTATVGAGVQLFVSRTLFLAPEVRVGYVPIARLTLAIGYSPVRPPQTLLSRRPQRQLLRASTQSE